MATELISPQGLRVDGRRQNELRNISIKLGVLGRCDGRAGIFYQHGNTKVIASISGPKNPSKSKKDENFVFNVRVKFATFSKNGERQKQMKNSKKLSEFELNLKNIFKSVIIMEKYEKSQLDLNIEVLQTDGGSEISAAVNAATLALIGNIIKIEQFCFPFNSISSSDAGICMKEYICACTASLTTDGVPLLDVSHLEEISGEWQLPLRLLGSEQFPLTGGPTLTIAALPRTGDYEQSVAFVELSQKFYLEDLNKIFDCALRGCEMIRTILDEAIRSNANETAISELTDN